MWTCHIVRLLSALSKAPAADDHFSAEVRRNATWLLWVFDWIPDEKETISFAENSQVTEQLFKAGLAACGQEVEEIAEAARDILLNWAIKGGRHQTGWGIFERALLAVAVLSVRRDGAEWEEWLRANLARGLEKDAALSMEERERTAKMLRQKVHELERDAYPVFAIEQVAMRVDRERLNSLLNAMADLLSQASPSS